MKNYIYIIAITTAIIAGCTNNSTNSSGKKVFRYNESKNISTLDPAFARNQSIIWPCIQIYNGLVQLDDSMKIIPCIAKSWKVSEDGLVYRFHLRRDVYFHNHPLFKRKDERLVNASDFVYSFNRIIDETVASPGMWVFNNINKKASETTNGFKAVNDSTFELYLLQPFPGIMGLLTIPYCSVVPEKIIRYYGKDFRSHPVGTGPFMLKLWAENEKLVLAKNPEYFEKDTSDTQLPYIEGIAITFISDKQSEFLEFMKGRLDFITDVNASFKDELLLRNGTLNPKYSEAIKMIKTPYLNTGYLGVQLDTNLAMGKTTALKNKYLRKAIAYAINRPKMMEMLRNNIGYPAERGFIPLGMPGYNPYFRGFYYNPDTAAYFLKLAGYPNGEGLLPIKLTTVSDFLDLCEFIQHDLQQIGINAQIEVVTGLAYREMLANGRMELYRASWIADYPDPENYMTLFYSKNFCPSGPNYSHFANDDFDNLYKMALSENNLQKRNIFYQKMEKILINETAVIPLYYDVALRFTHNNIQNIGINSMNILYLKTLIIK